jgi:cardiolipin synthase A/B
MRSGGIWAIGLLIALQGCANLAPLPSLPVPPANDAPLAVVGAGGKAVAPPTQRRIERAVAAQDPEGALRQHLAVMESISEAPLIAGNRVRLLVDGPAAYAAMFAAMDAARAHIDIEMFIFDEAQHAGRNLTDVLLAKAAQGVAVSVLYDSVG